MSSSDARHKCYSDCLCTALDKIGANQWMRRKYYELDAIRYICSELDVLNENGVTRRCPNIPITHRFGSSIEGTTTPGMVSDIDYIYIEHNNVVEQGCEGTNVADEKTVVVVTDMFTPPGYGTLKVNVKAHYRAFKLQQVSDGHYFMSNMYTDWYKQCDANFNKTGVPERHGPALMTPTVNAWHNSFDGTVAFRSKSWLSFNLEFFNRPRHHGWPSQETLDIMKCQGCLFVPTGHHFCKEEHRILQWGISFSFQERHLMLNLNTTQYKCYILLKLLKRHIHSPTMNLTSYHCKTSLLYTIENTDVHTWKEDNILKCFLLCLKRIKKWSRKRMCPSYFIPEVNLFTGKIEDQELNKLTHILTNIISRPQDYLQQISTDNFGKLVELYAHDCTDDENIEEKMDTQVGYTLHRLLHATASTILYTRNTVLLKILYKCSSVDEAIESHYKWLKTIQKFQSKSNIETYQLDRILWVLPYVCRFLHSSLASHLALKAVRSLNTQMKTWHTLSVAYHFWMGLQSDAHSGKMKLATFLFYTGYLSLDALKSNYLSTRDTVSICACTCAQVEQENACTIVQNLFKASPMETMKMSTSVFIEKYVSACTIFMPTESELTLYPLQFEMHRSFGCKPHKFDKFFQFHSERSMELDNCATLDSKVYYDLLMIYLTGKKERAEHVNMLLSCAADYTLVHRETTYNVLGWFISTEEDNWNSLMCYNISWDYTSRMQDYTTVPAERTMDRNAAKWHMVLLLYRAWFNKKLVK